MKTLIAKSVAAVALSAALFAAGYATARARIVALQGEVEARNARLADDAKKLVAFAKTLGDLQARVERMAARQKEVEAKRADLLLKLRAHAATCPGAKSGK